MKKTFVLFVLILTNLLAYTQSDYFSGFYEGYKNGYCQNKIGCWSPTPPIAPLPAIGIIINYQSGYNAGFILGMKDSEQADKFQNTDNNNNGRYKTSKSEDVDFMYKVDINNVYALADALKKLKGRAIALQDEKNYQEMLDLSLKGIKVSPHDPELLELCGIAYVNLQDYSNALSYLKQAIKYGADDAATLRTVVNDIESGDYQSRINK
ncbi:MAG: hypothetical protein JWN78_1095 [Bacteroidota bacterium]|nr:hypothetical protein [Bacteroidota bacterium]